MPDCRPRSPHAEPLRRGAIVVLVVALAAVAVDAAAAWNSPPVPTRPDLPVQLPAPPVPPATTTPTIPTGLLKPGATITLAEVVDIALQNNPLTRASYLAALSAAAKLGSERAPYYPNLDFAASATRSNLLSSNPSASGNFDAYGAGLGLSYLLLDMGGRSANVDDARYGLIAADWTHNATIQNVILGVETTYVQYVNAKAQLEAARANVKTAKTALSQAHLSAQTFEGQVLALRGALATAMGLPANTPYDVGILPEEVPLDRGTDTADHLIATAIERRPDLASARALASKADAHVRAVRSDGLPALSLSATAANNHYSPATPVGSQNSWSAGLFLRFPLFTGFANTYNIEQAKRDAGVARAQADTLEQQVILDVWTSYYFFQTATQLVRTSRDLLASAEQSERVALGRYKEGVGTIIDLLNAQAALATARSQEILARSGWFVALAQLAYDTGTTAPLDQPIAVLKESPKP
jgi:outer membrane protein